MLAASILKLQEVFWLRTATPEAMSDDAVEALFGWWWFAALAALLFVVLQAVLVLPILQRVHRRAAVASVALAVAVTIPFTLVYRAPAVEPWRVTFAVMCVVVGAPVLLQSATTLMLLRRAP